MHCKRLTKRLLILMLMLVFGILVFYIYEKERGDKDHVPFTSRRNGYHRNNKTYPGITTLLWWDSVYTSVDEIRKCGNTKCRITDNRELKNDLNTKVFLFYGSHFKPYDLPFPRRNDHTWALMHEESPRNAYILSHGNTMSIFNFTSSYNRKSDYPITTQWLQCPDWIQEKRYMLPLVDKNRLRMSGLAPILYLHSDCDVPSDRDSFVRLLQNYIQVDSYGSCVNNKQMPDRLRFHKDMSALNDDHFFQFVARYKFTLSMENYICDDYVTEKLWRPIRIGSVPIVFGAPNIREYLPSNRSAIFVDDYNDIEDLANFIHMLDTNDKMYRQYLKYKDTPIQNRNLLKILNKRDWQPDLCNNKNRNSAKYNGHGKYNSIFSGFECFLCKKVAKIREVSKTRTTSKTYIAESSHYSCPAPRMFDESGRYSVYSYKWAAEWTRGKYEAAALEELYLKQKPITEKQFYEIVRKYIKEEKPT